MKHGSVSQRHTRACPRHPDGSFAPHRCKGSWQWVVEYGRDSKGKRMQTSKAGFPTKAAAQSALKEAVQTLLADVHITDITMADYLNRWLTGKHALRPKTATLYGELTRNYLTPISAESACWTCAPITWIACTPPSPPVRAAVHSPQAPFGASTACSALP